MAVTDTFVPSANSGSTATVQFPAASAVVVKSASPSPLTSIPISEPASAVPEISDPEANDTTGASGAMVSTVAVTGSLLLPDGSTTCTDTGVPSASSGLKVALQLPFGPTSTVCFISSGATPVVTSTTLPGSAMPLICVPESSSTTAISGATASTVTSTASLELPASSTCTTFTMAPSAKSVAGVYVHVPSTCTDTESSATPSLSRSISIVFPGCPVPETVDPFACSTTAGATVRLIVSTIVSEILSLASRLTMVTSSPSVSRSVGRTVQLPSSLTIALTSVTPSPFRSTSTIWPGKPVPDISSLLTESTSVVPVAAPISGLSSLEREARANPPTAATEAAAINGATPVLPADADANTAGSNELS